MKKLNTILLVDDYDADNFIHRLVIERYGCAETIEVCRDGKQAIEYVNACIDEGRPLPDLIFLDINMPVMNGWEFLDAFEALSKDRDGGAVVVMLTTSLNPDDQAKAEGHEDVKAFTFKPLTEKSLNDVLLKFYPEAVKAG